VRPPDLPPSFRRGELAALAILLLVAAGLRAWNAWALPPLGGYDAPGHAGYVLTIVDDGRLPHPNEGWSTFHPPLYYLLGAAAWSALEPFGPRAVSFGLRAIGALAGLAGAFATYVCMRRLGGSPAVAWVATALVLFVPVSQMAAAMEGNEAFAAGLGALALPPLLSLQRDPGDLRAAATGGLVSGLALISKYNSLALLPACLVPFALQRPDRRALRSFALLVIVIAFVAGPFYLRNVALTGSPIPMTRDLEPMHTVEMSQILRRRELRDYLNFPLDSLRRPSLFQVAGKRGDFVNRNPAMSSIWGLTYASLWYDAFAHRIPVRYHDDSVHTGPAMMLFGLVPTTVMLLGSIAATASVVKYRGDTPYTPLVVLWISGVALFLAFTWKAPSAAAVKGSYMLLLAAPGAIFFALGVALAGPRLRVAILAASILAVLAATVVFTEGIVFRADVIWPGYWRRWAAQLPTSHIAEAITWLLGGPRVRP
jgi:hypothetical protein